MTIIIIILHKYEYFCSVKTDEDYMQLCVELATQGLGKTAPNPMVGAVLVYNNQIIGQGYHEIFGKAHAEVNCIESALKNVDESVLAESVLYVSLEPCSHHGKTPPCTDLILKHNIRKVVVGNTDPFALVNGAGIEKLRNAGIEVKSGILEEECRELNKRFITFHEKKRPYIILKWAQTMNGFISPLVNGQAQRYAISNEASIKLLHKWRSEEAAIMVGTNTVCIDNPKLNVREWSGKSPIRITIDKDLRIPDSAHLLDGKIQTLVFTSKAETEHENLKYIHIDFSQNILTQILETLHRMQIQSVLIEGGSMLLNSFIHENLWDEARVITSPKLFPIGISSPKLDFEPVSRKDIQDDIHTIYRNKYNL